LLSLQRFRTAARIIVQLCVIARIASGANSNLYRQLLALHIAQKLANAELLYVRIAAKPLFGRKRL
jgi:hypothetical protein